MGIKRIFNPPMEVKRALNKRIQEESTSEEMIEYGADVLEMMEKYQAKIRASPFRMVMIIIGVGFIFLKRTEMSNETMGYFLQNLGNLIQTKMN